MLLKREMGFTEEAVDSNFMTFPSITFCPGNMNNPKWPQALENITADYQKLPRIKDMLRLIKFPICINE